MTYELAKKLKDAGFPLLDIEEPRTKVKSDTRINNNNQLYDYIEIPTLSELIEACGDGLSELVREPQPDGSHSWWCRSKYPHDLLNHKTPKEAVAKLWLKLNK